jgi:hypothetical protein
VIKRAGAVFLLAKRTVRDGWQPGDQELRWFARQLKELLAGADQAITRADHTGNRITQLLTGTQGEVWFERAGQGIKWAKKRGVGNLFQGLRSYVVDSDGEAKYGEMLDKIRAYLDEQDQRLAAH